jgi:DNA-binding transcriptional LysR family regulator
MTAVRIKPRLRFAVVGSPAYFATRSLPKIPEDLKQHICIQNLYPSGTRYEWSFQKSGKEVNFQPTGPLSLDDHALMLQAAKYGVGLTYVWENHAVQSISDGSLVRVLEPWCAPEDWLYLHYPARKYLSTGLRA